MPKCLKHSGMEPFEMVLNLIRDKKHGGALLKPQHPPNSSISLGSFFSLGTPIVVTKEHDLTHLKIPGFETTVKRTKNSGQIGAKSLNL